VYGSIVAIGFVVAMLLIGALLALVVRGVHEGLSWLVRSGGGASALWEAIAATASVVAGFALLAVFVRLVVGLSRARGAARST
jgi:hypothetical protein